MSFINAIILCLTGDVFTAEPSDVEINCGMRNVATFLCNVTDLESTVPSWVINSTLKSSYGQLPINHKYDKGTLTVTNANKYNNSNYQCRIVVRNDNGQRCPYNSNNATLIVKKCG